MAPRLQLTSVTLGCADAAALANFYARLLGGEPNPSDPGWAQLSTESDGGRFTVNFEFEEQWTPPVWPAEPGHQFASQHLDILVDDLPAAVDHALACGARLAPHQPQESVRVMFDPAGHPFCLFL
ncbi:VOC family protein [Aestuariimicrobium kwangyangense]|uniref:VOC family protein n=1 Tax=Aestuariimicrobium kwangyangense TaxID=396389 RepID=UPI0003B3BEFD|nr:VOC family protein [Aestuariimicrobium kwangyangense]